MGQLENLSLLSEDLRGSRDRLELLGSRVAKLAERLRTDAPTLVSLDKLAQEARRALPQTEGERFEGDEAVLGLDAWEISLINEEG